MGPKKGRRVRKIEVPTDSVPEFELGDTEADIKRRREEREAREREEHNNRNRGRRQGITLARGGTAIKNAQDRNK